MKGVQERGDPPWTFQVELTEGCSRICGFCGINGIRSKPGDYKHLHEDLAGKIAHDISQLNPTARCEFAMHGEPLMNPSYLRIFSIFRAILPKAGMMVTTNGVRFRKNMQARMDEVFDAGIDFILLDTYYPERDELRAEAAKLTGITVKDFYDELAPAGWSPYANHHRKYQRFVCLMDDIGARDGEHPARKLHNHAGSNPVLPTPSEPLAKTCTKPFRELSITWNGEVRLCCEDWIGDYVCGNVSEKTLAEIWRGPQFEAARTMLQSKRRDFGACKNCDAPSGMRVGLMPKYPPVTDAEVAVVRAAEQNSAGRPRLVQLRKKEA
jgi:radical SAM protein with 4Fe4S-binding SPASM domain